jgi:hypothetical protein
MSAIDDKVYLAIVRTNVRKMIQAAVAPKQKSRHLERLADVWDRRFNTA